MKRRVPIACASCLLVVTTAAFAQTPPEQQQQQPHAQRQQGEKQEQKQNTAPKGTTGPASASTPRNTGAADKDTFQSGAKPDASAGCSTPTDAKSAGVSEKAKESNARTRPGEKRTVCTTAGAEGVGASDKKRSDDAKKSASAPSSTASQPR